MNIPKSQRKNNPLSMERYAKFLRKKLLFKKFHQEALVKSQSAMEYLMTYGWSILIVAVVLGALSFLGVFNPLTFTPKASAGGCQVIKNTELGISNLEGSCNNQIPIYAASFNGNALVNVGNENTVDFGNGVTISAWIKISESTVNWYNIVYKGKWCGGQNTMFDSIVLGNGNNLGLCYANNGPEPAVSLKQNTWYNIMYSANSTAISFYLNGVHVFTQSGSFTANTNSANMLIGSGDLGNAGIKNFVGLISNVQVYNISLSNSSIKTLYARGIGSTPVDLQNLIGWWPLNGDVNDYSGNNNNGVPTNVLYTSNWYNGYTQP